MAGQHRGRALSNAHFFLGGWLASCFDICILSRMRTVVYQPILEDLDAAYRRHLFYMIFSRKWMRRYGLIFVGLLAVGYVISFEEGVAARLADAASGLLFPAIVMGLVIVAQIFVVTPLRSKRIFRQQRSLNSETTVTWSDSDIHFSAGDFSARLTWAEIVAVLEDRKSIILLPSDYMLFILPKRVLLSFQIADIMEQARKSDA